MWELDVPHGNCGMELESSADDSKLEFLVKIDHSGTADLEMMDFNTNQMVEVRVDPSLGKPSLQFKCAYEKAGFSFSDKFCKLRKRQVTQN